MAKLRSFFASEVDALNSQIVKVLGKSAVCKVELSDLDEFYLRLRIVLADLVKPNDFILRKK